MFHVKRASVEGIWNVLPKQLRDFGNRTFQSETNKKLNGCNDVVASARTAQSTLVVVPFHCSREERETSVPATQALAF
jgi:hypothetical protein